MKLDLLPTLHRRALRQNLLQSADPGRGWCPSPGRTSTFASPQPGLPGVRRGTTKERSPAETSLDLKGEKGVHRS